MTDAELTEIENAIGSLPIAYGDMQTVMRLVAEVRRLKAENADLRRPATFEENGILSPTEFQPK